MDKKLVNSLNEPITEKILNELGSKIKIPVSIKKKQETIKTIFKISSWVDSQIRQFANESNMSIREFLDVLAGAAEKASEDNSLWIGSSSIDDTKGRKIYVLLTSPSGGGAKRVGYTISRNAKETFEMLSKKRGVSRDEILTQVFFTYYDKQLKNSLTTRERIDYAKKVDDAQTAMLKIFSDMQSYAVALEDCGDADLPSEIHDMLAYLEHSLLEYDFRSFIEKKEEDLKNGIERGYSLDSFLDSFVREIVSMIKEPQENKENGDENNESRE